MYKIYLQSLLIFQKRNFRIISSNKQNVSSFELFPIIKIWFQLLYSNVWKLLTDLCTWLLYSLFWQGLWKLFIKVIFRFDDFKGHLTDYFFKFLVYNNFHRITCFCVIYLHFIDVRFGCLRCSCSFFHFFEVCPLFIVTNSITTVYFFISYYCLFINFHIFRQSCSMPYFNFLHYYFLLANSKVYLR